MNTWDLHSGDTEVDGIHRYKAVDPVVFKQGDIVEATVSFAVMLTKNKTAKMHVLLRALVLMDHTERDVSKSIRKSRPTPHCQDRLQPFPE
jgi:hypothetical protein